MACLAISMADRKDFALQSSRMMFPHIEQKQIDGIEAIDDLLTEELSLRENRRIKAALRRARLPPLKTLAGYDSSFQPLLVAIVSRRSPGSILSVALG
jgi:hypothetical protein